MEHPADVPSCIRARRATKQFKPDPLPAGALDRLLELTTAAPSSFNIQDWRIVVVQDPDQKAALAAAAYNQPQITTAPVSFVFEETLRLTGACHIPAGNMTWDVPFDRAIEDRFVIVIHAENETAVDHHA